MTIVQVCLAVWVIVAIALAIAFDRDDKEGCLAYRATGDKMLKFMGSLFTALLWPILVPIAIMCAVSGVRSKDL